MDQLFIRIFSYATMASKLLTYKLVDRKFVVYDVQSWKPYIV